MNKKLIAGAGLAALALVGGTFAYFNEALTIDNPLNTGKYDAVMYEDFTPPADDMNPGTHWDKAVGAQNTGDYPVLVRVKMDETWTRKGDGGATYKTMGSVETATNDKGATNAIFRDRDNYDADTGVFTASQFSAEDNAISVKGDTDGKVPDGNTGNVDHTVIFKNILDKTADPDSKWVDGGDGYWYWNGVLDQDEKTDLLLDGLVMATNIDMGDYESTEYYHISLDNEKTADDIKYESTDDTYWTPIDFNVPVTDDNDFNKDGIYDIRDIAQKNGIGVKGNANEKRQIYRKSESHITSDLGYADSSYTLKITSEFVQATKDAVAATWGDEEVALIGTTLDKVEFDGDNSQSVIDVE